MKQLTCEMCGSTELIKQDGFFVCQTCGTKYSVEEAKKMMIEGTVEVQGTVKVDNSDNIEKYYQIARRAKDDNDSETAEKYYSLILEENPKDWEAAFYKLRFSCMRGTRGQLENNTYKFANSLESIYKLIHDSDMSTNDKCHKYLKVHNECTGYLTFALSNFTSWGKSLSDPESALSVFRTGRDCVSYLYIILGDCNAKYFLPISSYAPGGEGFAKENMVVGCYKFAINEEGETHKYRAVAIERIKKHVPDYTLPEKAKKVKAGGCYVATCVYGSYDCPEVWTLRRYRDNTLGSTWYGRAFIKFYYAISPTLVKWFGKTKWFKKMWKGKLDRMVKKLQDNGVENTPYNDRTW